MRIISKFTDYYDSAARYGFDEKLIYHRITEPLDIKADIGINPIYTERTTYGVWNSRKIADLRFVKNDRCAMPYEAQIYGFAIVFCGIVYRGIMVGEHAFYSADSLIKFIAENGSIHPSRYYSRIDINNDWFDVFEQYFAVKVNQDRNEYTILNRLPIIAVTPGHREFEYEKDAVLKKYEFFKVMDSFTAFQELSMFIGSIMAPENKEIISISDKDRVQQHGFDNYSFRKLPTKHK